MISKSLQMSMNFNNVTLTSNDRDHISNAFCHFPNSKVTMVFGSKNNPSFQKFIELATSNLQGGYTVKGEIIFNSMKSYQEILKTDSMIISSLDYDYPDMSFFDLLDLLYYINYPESYDEKSAWKMFETVFNKHEIGQCMFLRYYDENLVVRIIFNIIIAEVLGIPIVFFDMLLLDNLVSDDLIEILYHLEQLAEVSGHTVVIFTNKLSPEIIEFSNHCILLASKYVIYDGPTLKTEEAFLEQGFQKPLELSLTKYLTFLIKSLENETEESFKKCIMLSKNIEIPEKQYHMDMDMYLLEAEYDREKMTTFYYWIQNYVFRNMSYFIVLFFAELSFNTIYFFYLVNEITSTNCSIEQQDDSGTVILNIFKFKKTFVASFLKQIENFNLKKFFIEKFFSYFLVRYLLFLTYSHNYSEEIISFRKNTRQSFFKSKEYLQSFLLFRFIAYTIDLLMFFMFFILLLPKKTILHIINFITAHFLINYVVALTSFFSSFMIEYLFDLKINIINYFGFMILMLFLVFQNSNYFPEKKKKIICSIIEYGFEILFHPSYFQILIQSLILCFGIIMTLYLIN